MGRKPAVPEDRGRRKRAHWKHSAIDSPQMRSLELQLKRYHSISSTHTRVNSYQPLSFVLLHPFQNSGLRSREILEPEPGLVHKAIRSRVQEDVVEDSAE